MRIRSAYDELRYFVDEPEKGPLTYPPDWPAIFHAMEFVRRLHEPSERSRLAVISAMKHALSRPV